MPDKKAQMVAVRLQFYYFIFTFIFFFLAMDNCYHSAGWPDPESDGMNYWPNYNFSLHNESTFPLTWQPSPYVNSASSSIHKFHEFPSCSIDPVGQGVAEDKATAISKSHSQAEKRRRDRINAQLATLRKLIPKSEKMDKAALLGTVIEHVKDLKLKAMEVSKTLTIPTEVDEVTVVDCHQNQAAAAASSTTKIVNKSKGNTNILIKASVCCDDQPELFREIIRVLKGLGLSTVSADISSVGGRIKSILVLCNKDGDHQESVSLGRRLKQSLHLVLNRMSSSSMASNYCIRSKRQRLFLPSH